MSRPRANFRDLTDANDAIDVLRAELDALKAALEQERQRIRELAAMFGVPDGGQYLNDWKERAAALLADREENEE